MGTDRRAATTRRATTRRATISAAAGCAALAVYAGLKGVWALGGGVGVRDTAGWSDMLGQLTAGERFAALWGTVLVDVAGAALLVVLATQPWRSAASWVPRTVRALGWAAGAALTAAGLAGLLVSAGPATGLWQSAPGDAGPLQEWVFVVVYGAFLVAGASFLVTAHATRPARATGTVRPDAHLSVHHG